MDYYFIAQNKFRSQDYTKFGTNKRKAAAQYNDNVKKILGCLSYSYKSVKLIAEEARIKWKLVQQLMGMAPLLGMIETKNYVGVRLKRPVKSATSSDLYARGLPENVKESIYDRIIEKENDYERR